MILLLKRITVAGLTLMLSWNVVFGVFGQGVLCLHKEISAHLELEPEAHGPCQADSATGVQVTGAWDDCPPCIDIEIRGESFESTRAVELVKVPSVPQDVLSYGGFEGAFPSFDEVFERACPPRAPPLLKAQSVIVARTHVLLV